MSCSKDDRDERNERNRDDRNNRNRDDRDDTAEPGEDGRKSESPDRETRGESRGESREARRGEDGGEDDDDDGPLPPPEDDKELLFLIEFLVDTLSIRHDALMALRFDPCLLQGQNCVMLTFMHFPPMSICEKDINEDKNVGELVTLFNSGKSLVFALTEAQFENPPPVYLEVGAWKEMPHGFRIPNIQLGTARVDLSELFRMVFDKYDETPDQLPVAKSIKDSYEMSANGRVTADVGIYIRLTCLGQNIVTEFQKSDGVCNPFLFKNLESGKVYECKQTGQNKQEAPIHSCRRSTAPKADPDPEDEMYEQIYAEINGSALTVNIEKSKRKAKPKPYRLDQFCDCEIPLPPELVEGISDLSVSPVCVGKSEIPEGSVGRCQNKLIFQVPPSDKLAMPDGRNNVKYNVSTCYDGEKHGHRFQECFKVFSEGDAVMPSMPNDPDKDVFVLRITKKGKSAKGKGNLELEFRVPKEKIEPPPKPPYMIDRECGPEKQKKDKKKKKK
ncbi:UNVERIFIED_CONTAM: hypothetical protein PYX00_001537 [Menopon gallinae]|uniref:Uncharacterized protein n=1 Tax=Menopon gallinae TaxID=328185 RepID=A0AAW2IEG7_9NEOP